MKLNLRRVAAILIVLLAVTLADVGVMAATASSGSGSRADAVARAVADAGRQLVSAEAPDGRTTPARPVATVSDFAGVVRPVSVASALTPSPCGSKAVGIALLAAPLRI